MKNELYYCFSANQKEWLDRNGLNFKFEGIHKTTGNTFYAYTRGRVLEMLLKEYNEGKNKE